MSAWVREPKSDRLIRVERIQAHITVNPTLAFDANMADEQPPPPVPPMPRSFSQIFYPLILYVFKLWILVKMCNLLLALNTQPYSLNLVERVMHTCF